MIAKAEESKTQVAPRPNPDAAIAFVKRWKKDGPWVLTAIFTRKKGTTTRTFRPADEEALRAWLAEHDRDNLYFMVNEPTRDLISKAAREDVAALAWLHVDMDPRAGEDLQAERERALRLLRQPPGDLPPPTCIVFSGGGYNALWALSEPLPIDGDLEKAEAAKLYNLQLEIAFGADSVHNIDRILRLPGTINWPNKVKRKKGRTPELAELVEWHEDRVYPIERFTPASAVRTADDLATTRVQITGSPRLKNGVDDLPDTVSDRTKMLIVQGSDPDDPTKYESRSEALFGVCCELVRAGLTDDMIYAVVTDPDFGISASVLDKGASKQRYAVRQIGRARDLAADFDRDENGRVYKTQRNVRLAIVKLGVTLEHDEFADRSHVNGLEGFGPHLDDKALNRLWLLVESRFGLSVGKEKFYAIVADEALENRRHPVREYLDSVQKGWDQEPRLDRLLIDYCGAEDTPYVRAVGSKALIAAVRRVRQPGCKFDEMLILEGPQGNEKSTVLLVLAVREEWHTDDLPLHADTKRQMETLAGRWIIEAGELKGMRRGEVEALKSFLSRQVDRARLAYGRATTELPRQSIIVGTTNASQYLRDVTGNRRFWPVRTGKINLEALRRDRDQLWAEAAHREAQRESIRLDPKHWAAAAEEQEAREQPNPFVEPLSEALDGLVGKIASADVWRLLSLEEPGRRTQQHNNDLGDAMRRIGWERTKRRIGGKLRRCYVRGDDLEAARELVARCSGEGWAVVGADETEPF